MSPRLIFAKSYHLLQAPDEVYMELNPVMEWHFKQIEHTVGLSFRNNFHFALVGHLLKGFRHPNPDVVNRTQLVLDMMLTLISKLNAQRRLAALGHVTVLNNDVNNTNVNSSMYGREQQQTNNANANRDTSSSNHQLNTNGSTVHADKFNTCRENIAYLAALLPVSSEVQSKLRLRYRNWNNGSIYKTSNGFSLSGPENRSPAVNSFMSIGAFDYESSRRSSSMQSSESQSSAPSRMPSERERHPLPPTLVLCIIQYSLHLEAS